MHAETLGLTNAINFPIRDRDAIALELALVKIFAHKLLITLFQFMHCILPYNAYDAIIEEFIENTKFERLENQPGVTASARSGPLVRRPATGLPAVRPREPFGIPLMKLLHRARIDLLRRVHAVLERDNETLVRLGEEQATKIDRYIGITVSQRFLLIAYSDQSFCR